MPGFDRRGPMGSGPMTGRGMGLCNAQTADGIREEFPRSVNRPGLGMRRGFARGFGGGYGGGFGAGYGARRGYWQSGTQVNAPVDEMNLVRDEVQTIKGTLTRLEERLAALSKSGAGQ